MPSDTIGNAIFNASDTNSSRFFIGQPSSHITWEYRHQPLVSWPLPFFFCSGLLWMHSVFPTLIGPQSLCRTHLSQHSFSLLFSALMIAKPHYFISYPIHYSGQQGLEKRHLERGYRTPICHSHGQVLARTRWTISSRHVTSKLIGKVREDHYDNFCPT